MNARAITPPTDEQVGHLLDACKPNTTGQRNRALVALLRYAGLRVTEAIALEPRDLRTVRAPGGHEYTEVHVRRGKGGKPRHVAMLAGGEVELRRWLEARAALDLPASARLFCVCNGKRAGAPLTRAYIDAMLKRLAYDAGFPSAQRIHAHALRHAFATSMHHDGRKLVTIQQQLGHAHAITTERYLAGLTAHGVAADLFG